MSYRDVIQGSLEVKATGLWVIVGVGLQLHPSISEDGCMVPPGGLGQVHIPGLCMETGLREGSRNKDSGEKKRLSFISIHDEGWICKKNKKYIFFLKAKGSGLLPGSWLRFSRTQFQKLFGQ